LRLILTQLAVNFLFDLKKNKTKQDDFNVLFNDFSVEKFSGQMRVRENQSLLQGKILNQWSNSL
jgi:hypothetical protein